MAKLRHIAIQVPDLEKAASFYEGVFGLKRLKKVEAPIGNAISLSDGVMNLTLLQFPEGTKGGKGGPDWAGLHHFGFIVDSEDATEQEIKKRGGEFFIRHSPDDSRTGVSIGVLRPCRNTDARCRRLPAVRAARTMVEGLIWPFSLVIGHTPPIGSC